MSKSLIEQIKELLKHIESNPNALNKIEKDFYFQTLQKAKIIDFKTKQTLADEGQPLLPSPAKGKLTGIEGKKGLAVVKPEEKKIFKLKNDTSKLLPVGSKVKVKNEYTEGKKDRSGIATIVDHKWNPYYNYVDSVLKFPEGHELRFGNHEIEKVKNKIHVEKPKKPEQVDLNEVKRILNSKGILSENDLNTLSNRTKEIKNIIDISDPNRDNDVLNNLLSELKQHETRVKQSKSLIGTTNKSETYYKDLVESTLEKAKKSKKPFHGYNPKKHAKTGGLNDKYRKKVNRETGSDLKRPSKDKGNPRHKSFCARMKGVKGPTSKEGKLTPKGAALKRWNCSKNEHSDESLCKKSRCWAGYEPTPGKKPYSKGSCRPIKKNDYFSSLIKKTLKHD